MDRTDISNEANVQNSSQMNIITWGCGMLTATFCSTTFCWPSPSFPTMHNFLVLWPYMYRFPRIQMKISPPNCQLQELGSESFFFNFSLILVTVTSCSLTLHIYLSLQIYFLPLRPSPNRKHTKKDKTKQNKTESVPHPFHWLTRGAFACFQDPAWTPGIPLSHGSSCAFFSEPLWSTTLAVSCEEYCQAVQRMSQTEVIWGFWWFSSEIRSLEEQSLWLIRSTLLTWAFWCEPWHLPNGHVSSLSSYLWHFLTLLFHCH